MIDFLFLVPISLVLGLVGLVAFLWCLRSRQYDDLDGDAERILFTENEGPIRDDPSASSHQASHVAEEAGSSPSASCRSSARTLKLH